MIVLHLNKITDVITSVTGYSCLVVYLFINHCHFQQTLPEYGFINS